MHCPQLYKTITKLLKTYLRVTSPIQTHQNRLALYHLTQSSEVKFSILNHEGSLLKITKLVEIKLVEIVRTANQYFILLLCKAETIAAHNKSLVMSLLLYSTILSAPKISNQVFYKTAASPEQKPPYWCESWNLTSSTDLLSKPTLFVKL